MAMNDKEAANQRIDQMLAKIKSDNAKVKVTPEQVLREASFLLGWAKTKLITKYDDSSSFYCCGKLMTKAVPAMVKALLADGHAVGTELAFKMVKPAKPVKVAKKAKA